MRSTWARPLLLALCCTANGCGSQTILVPAGHTVRLAEPVEARIYTSDGHGGYVASENRQTIPQGYYVVPPPSTQSEK